MHFLLIFLISHELLHRVDNGKDAVVVEFYFADNSKFSYEEYKVFRPGNSRIPFAVGRTDALGRVVFLPDTDGVWRVKVTSNTGHGADLSIKVTQGMVNGESSNVMFFNILRFLLGLILIIGVFVLLSKNTKHKKEANV